MKIKKEWTCKKCQTKHDGEKGVCMVCKTDETIIKGPVNAPKSTKTANSHSASNPAAAKIRPAELCDALCRALDLEAEGRQFYTDCEQKTESLEGKAMFKYLAHEEKVHYEKIASIFEKNDYKGYCEYVEAKGLTSGIFKPKVTGSRLDKKSDALDALNISLSAEENSIELYSRLSADAEKTELREFFGHLVDEERKHRNILQNEIEFLTDTGQFRDFKTVTT
jgi:rubrerythrin